MRLTHLKTLTPTPLYLPQALYQTAFPHTAVLGKVPGSTIYRNIKQYKESQVWTPLTLMTPAVSYST